LCLDCSDENRSRSVLEDAYDKYWSPTVAFVVTTRARDLVGGRREKDDGPYDGVDSVRVFADPRKAAEHAVAVIEMWTGVSGTSSRKEHVDSYVEAFRATGESTAVASTQIKNNSAPKFVVSLYRAHIER
jgi:hypothetical protein